MRDKDYWRCKASVEHVAASSKDLEQVANNLCKQALDDAKSELHPLIRNVELDRLDRRHEFIQAFKFALEERIAHKLAIWQPYVQAVFRFDESCIENRNSWDGSIHLLVKVPHLSNAIIALSAMLDQCLIKYLRRLGWSRFRKQQSVLEILQVTPSELRHGISYGAMFCAVHSVPVKVWPLKGPAR